MIKKPIKIFIFFLFFLISKNAFCFNYNLVHEFEIFRNNKKIGFHKLSFQIIENKIIVNTQINMVVKLGPIPVFKYLHEGEETWINNEFVKAKTYTKKNNREFNFLAHRKGKKIEIETRGKKFNVTEDTLITSYWQKNWLKKKILIDSQNGKKRLINVEKMDIEPIKVEDLVIYAQKYKVTGTQDKPNGKKIDYDIWYDDKDRWVKIKFFIKKSLIEYYLVTKY